MNLPDLILRGHRVVTRDGVRPATVHVRRGMIERVGSEDEVPAGPAVIDCGGDVLMPGIVDTHVHVNEPGRTEWEGFETATSAAAAGGITTIVDMPLNCIPVTTSLDALKTKLSAIEDKLHVDCAFWGGVVPGNAGELNGMIDAG